MSFLSTQEIKEMGFSSVGENVKISSAASFYNCSRINLGDNCRIDDFCVLSAGVGGIKIGINVHIAVYSSLIGSGLIEISDFCNLSSKVSIYSSNDDYSGETMTNPTIPSEFTDVTHADVFLGKHVIIGSGSVILPGITLEEGVAVGALSLVSRDCKAFGVYVGRPVRRIKDRKNSLLDVERLFREKVKG